MASRPDILAYFWPLNTGIGLIRPSFIKSVSWNKDDGQAW